MNPPPWPARESDLDAWHVYADWMNERGDLRGPIVALELSLPARPSAAARDEFRRRAQRLKRIHRTLRGAVELAWSLGHVRELAIRDGTVADGVRAALADPSMALVEEVSFTDGTIDFADERHRALFHALPSSCVRVVAPGAFRPREAAWLLERLPPSVTTLAVTGGRPELLVSDRLSVLEVRCPLDGLVAVGRLIAALESTRTVRVHVTRLPAAVERPPRIRVGHAGDAALAAPGGRVVVLRRPSLRTIQTEHGLVPIRALLSRALPERHRLTSLEGQRAFGFGTPNVVLTRGGDGRWSMSGRDGVVSIHDGYRLLADGVEWTFVEDVAMLDAG
jgi:hypothetical protein